MKVITEAALRSQYRREPFTAFQLAAGQLLTPSAAGWLTERRITLVEAQAETTASSERAPGPAGPAEEGDKQRSNADRFPFVSLLDGGRYAVKPEHMTHLSGNRLLPKDHPRIVFRGRLDSLQSTILLLQDHALDKGLPGLAEELGQILDQCRRIMQGDVQETELATDTILGLGPDELRRHSHDPKRFYGIGHLTPTVEMGRTLLLLNDLRSKVREVEIAAVAAFTGHGQILRQDILQALNRMSSAVYILMIREQAGNYAGRTARRVG
jgi:ethanolamine utilization cobalamin adenosyltransferase